MARDVVRSIASTAYTSDAPCIHCLVQWNMLDWEWKGGCGPIPYCLLLENWCRHYPGHWVSWHNLQSSNWIHSANIVHSNTGSISQSDRLVTLLIKLQFYTRNLTKWQTDLNAHRLHLSKNMLTFLRTMYACMLYVLPVLATDDKNLASVQT